MIELVESGFLIPTTGFRKMALLAAIQESSVHSQHGLGTKTNLSSSMVNNYIKTLKKEGLIYSNGETNRSQTYHLTQEGRGSLMSQLFSYSAEIVQMYSAVKKEIRKILDVHYGRGIRSVVLFGASETAEIVYTVLKDSSFKIIGVVDNDQEKQGHSFNEFTVFRPSLIREMAPDAVVITSFGKQEEIYKCLRRDMGTDQYLIKLTDTTVDDPNSDLVLQPVTNHNHPMGRSDQADDQKETYKHAR